MNAAKSYTAAHTATDEDVAALAAKLNAAEAGGWVIVREDTDAEHGWTYDHQPAVAGPYATFGEADVACRDLDDCEGWYIVVQRQKPAAAAEAVEEVAEVIEGQPLADVDIQELGDCVWLGLGGERTHLSPEEARAHAARLVEAAGEVERNVERQARLFPEWDD
ncbi:MAG TPA: hypothetical protein VGN22_15965 [Pseudonocardia sp.]|jgi:hypothetical protein